MPRLSIEKMKQRYAAIRNILDNYPDDVITSTGHYNYDRIREMLKELHAFDVSDTHLRKMITDGKGRVDEKKPGSVNFPSLIKDFKDAIKLVKSIMKDDGASPKLKLDAMKTMRDLEMGLIKLVDDINSAEIEKAALNRPILELRFGRPLGTTKENLAKQKAFEEEEK